MEPWCIGCCGLGTEMCWTDCPMDEQTEYCEDEDAWLDDIQPEDFEG